MTTQERVAVVVPAFNCSLTIVTALDSVRRQTLSPDEVWVIDDHSSCNVSEVVSAYIAQHNLSGWACHRLPANVGAGMARDFGARCAQSTWLAFLDSDDAWCATHLERALTVAGSGLLDVFGAAVGNVCPPSEAASNPRLISLRALMYRNWLLTSTVLMRRAAYLRVGGFEEGLRYSEDYRLWLKLSVQRDLRIGVAPEVHAIYRADARPGRGLSAQLWRMERAELANMRWLWVHRHISMFGFAVAATWSLLRYVRRLTMRLAN